MENKKIVGLVVASIILGVSIVSVDASCYRKNSRIEVGIVSACLNAVKNDDYDSWKSLMDENSDSEALKGIDTQDEFERLVEAYRLVKEGDREAAEEIFEDLGISFKDIFSGKNFSLKNERKEYRSMNDVGGEIYEAIDNNDYDSWKTLMEERGGKILEIIDSEDDFNKFVEAKSLQKEGDYEGAKEILDELGFPFRERGFVRFSSR